MMPGSFTGKVQWRPKIVMDKLLEHAEPGIILEEIHLGDLMCSRRLDDQLDESLTQLTVPTSRFFI